MAGAGFRNLRRRGPQAGAVAQLRVIRRIKPGARGDVGGDVAAPGAGMKRQRAQEAGQGIEDADLAGGRDGTRFGDTEHLEREMEQRGGGTLRIRLERGQVCRRFIGKVARARVGGNEVWLIAPQTFMNRSGQGVLAMANFYKIAPEQILVVHDELDLTPGSAKLKFGGGIAGHNGLKDIAARLGTHDFWRLRIGIGHPGDRDAVTDYVLERAPPDEQSLVDDAVTRGLEMFPLAAAGELEAAMLRLHTRKP
jgi:peptidyl-tRNA hydrolase, PTH1 family